MLVTVLEWCVWLFCGRYSICEFHDSLQGTFGKEKGIEIKNITYFQSIMEDFRYALLLLWFCFIFSLNYMNLYLKALCSVYFLEKITWLYVYCKYIKYTIFVFNMNLSAWLLSTHLFKHNSHETLFVNATVESIFQHFNPIMFVVMVKAYQKLCWAVWAKCWCYHTSMLMFGKCNYYSH